jgi:hypothetical protein
VIRRTDEFNRVQEIVSKAYKETMKSISQGHYGVSVKPENAGTITVLPLSDPGQRLCQDLYVSSRSDEDTLILEGSIMFGFEEPEKALLSIDSVEDTVGVTVWIDRATYRYSRIQYSYFNKNENRTKIIEWNFTQQ